MHKGHRLVHYYHIGSDWLWQTPFNEHLTALTDSGLLDALDFIGVGIVGAEANREEVKRVLPPEFHVVAEAGVGFEQITHAALVAGLTELEQPSKIFYCHTKGAFHHRHDQDNWRKEMTQGVVYHWRECVDLLDQYDAVGCRYRMDPWRHYSGTFWAATSSYLSTLAPISYVYRDDAESWIGQSSTGGTHVEIDPSTGLITSSNSFGRIYVCKRDEYGHSYSNPYDIDQPRLGDEYVDFPSTEGNRIVMHLLTNGATFSIKGHTIIVESVK